MTDARSDGWFRSDAWDEPARVEFERRLARARPGNRGQYRRIKAIALLHAGDPARAAAGRTLLEQNLAAPETARHERVTALSVLAAHDQAAGRLDVAERGFREALAIAGPHGSGMNAEEEIALAEILLERGTREAVVEAGNLLGRRASEPLLFVRSRYRLSVAQVRAHLALGAPDDAAEWARAALELAATAHSGLAHHSTIGLVEPDARALSWLREVAGATGRIRP